MSASEVANSPDTIKWTSRELKFKEKILEHPTLPIAKYFDDEKLFQFIRRAICEKWNYHAFEKNVKEYISFITKYHDTKIDKDAIDLCGKNSFMSVYGLGNEGRPVVYMRYKYFKLSIMNELSSAQIKQFITKASLNLQHCKSWLSSKHNKRIFSHYVVHDLEDLAISDVMMNITVVKSMFQTIENFFPYEGHKIFVINCGFFTQAIYNMVYGFLSTDIQSRIIVLGDDYENEMKKYISPEQIPICYGGLNESPLTRNAILKEQSERPEVQSLID